MMQIQSNHRPPFKHLRVPSPFIINQGLYNHELKPYCRIGVFDYDAGEIISIIEWRNNQNHFIYRNLAEDSELMPCSWHILVDGDFIPELIKCIEEGEAKEAEERERRNKEWLKNKIQEVQRTYARKQLLAQRVQSILDKARGIE